MATQLLSSGGTVEAQEWGFGDKRKAQIMASRWPAI